jgi:AbrB family looped-hinge helix DNA binding protein
MQAKDTTTLSAKVQISIPKAVRTARQWQAGQEFAFIPKGTGVLLVPVPVPTPAALAGMARGRATIGTARIAPDGPCGYLGVDRMVDQLACGRQRSQLNQRTAQKRSALRHRRTARVPARAAACVGA